jgi:hypothetical protein
MYQQKSIQEQLTITPGKYSTGTFDEICNNNEIFCLIQYQNYEYIILT